MFNLIDPIRKFVSNHRAKAEDVFSCEVYDLNGEKIFATHDIDEFLRFQEELGKREDDGTDVEEENGPYDCEDCCCDDCDCDHCETCHNCYAGKDEYDGETLYAELAERTETPVAGILAASALIASLASLIITVRKK